MDKYSHLLPSVKPKSYIQEQMKMLLKEGIPDGLRTGIDELDEVARLQLGSFVIVTGYAGVGKSEFIDWLCYRYHLRYGYKTLYYSPENPTTLHLPKLISKFTGKSYNSLSPEERDRALEYVCDNFLFFDTSQDKYIDDVIAEAEKNIIEHGVRVVVFEPYNSFICKMTDGNIFELNTIRVILTKLRNLAIKHTVLVIISAHPKKPNDMKLPTAYDIAHSADFKNRADYNISVHRNPKDKEVRIGVDKLRDKNFGKGGECRISYDNESGNYYSSNEYEDCDYVHESIELPMLTRKPDVLDVDVSLYKGTNDSTGKGVVNLRDWLMSKNYLEIVNKVRQGGTPQERKNIKLEMCNEIPCVTISGVFNKRDSENLAQPSGLLAIDIDNVEKNKDIMSQVPEILKQFDFIAYIGRSISGDGYFAILPIEQSKHHKQHFYAIEAILKDKGITIDAQCKDVTRLRLASDGEVIYHNPNASTFYYEASKSSVSAPLPTKRKDKNKTSTTCTDEERLNKEIEYLKNNNIVFADDYTSWFNLGMSLSSLGEEKGRYYFHQFSSLSSKYDEDECNKQFDDIISHYGEQNEFTLGTAIDMLNKVRDNNLKIIDNEKFE